MQSRFILCCLFCYVLCALSCKDIKHTEQSLFDNEGIDVAHTDFTYAPIQEQIIPDTTLYEHIVYVALGEVGQIEQTTNWSPRIKEYLAVCNIKTPAYWCGAFTAWNNVQAGAFIPNGCAWTPNWFPKQRVYWNKGDDVNKLLSGTQVGFYFPSKKRIAHIGVVYYVEDGVIYTIEGNATKNTASRNGDGVYIKMRQAWEIYQSADWTKAQ